MFTKESGAKYAGAHILASSWSHAISKERSKAHDQTER
jgi:hypothetical protein